MKTKDQMDIAHLKALVRDVPDFPKKGIIFKDITPILKHPEALRFACRKLAALFKNDRIQQVVGIESRGFIFGAAVACELGAGFVPVRKNGKLPWSKESISYALEYGKDTLEIHQDAVERGMRCVIIDDLLATGGTAEAVTQLIEKIGGTVAGLAFLVELQFLNGRRRLDRHPVHSLIKY